jgi:preprotein translocase subunit Sec63
MLLSKTLRLIFFISVCVIAVRCWDPYEVLGLKRGASTTDIRRAYKQYAREW